MGAILDADGYCADGDSEKAQKGRRFKTKLDESEEINACSSLSMSMLTEGRKMANDV